jgi:hypothetical protein
VRSAQARLACSSTARSRLSIVRSSPP